MSQSEYYISDAKGDSVDVDGTKDKPFKSLDLLFGHLQITKDQPISFKIFTEKDSEFHEISKAQIKKAKAAYLNKKKSSDKVASTVSQKQEEFKEVKFDETLPSLSWENLEKLSEVEGQRILIWGWVQFIRKQSKKLWFASIRNGSGYVQCVFENDLCKTKDSLDFCEECSIKVWGTVKATGNQDPTHEVHVDYFVVTGKSLPGGIDAVLNVESDVETRFDNRHLMLRGVHTSRTLQLQSVVLRALRRFFEEEEMKEITPPTLVETQAEGAGSLFSLQYFSRSVNLAQTAQLYLESVVPALGKCFAITRSYRAEKSRTRRHLAEFNHVEAELSRLSFSDLLDHMEHMVVRVSEIILELDSDLVLTINPDFKVPKKPFMRMEYKDAITFLQEHGILDKNGERFEFGMDITESQERMMLDILKVPMMITKFPVELKAFYMPRCQDDSRVTESVDVLLPGVGEIVGGSMRIWDLDELMMAYTRNDLDPDTYSWYTDLRRWGSVPHGGYGLGFERFMMWVGGKDHIRDVCLYPRYIGRSKP